jgi:hypothetical protein
MNSLRHVFAIPILIVCLVAGCASPPAPINYLAIEKPQGPISSGSHNSVQKEFSRGGWYVGNHNFRPAPDVRSYLEDLSKTAGTSILRNADVEIEVPFAFDILFFGYNSGTDTASAKGK